MIRKYILENPEFIIHCKVAFRKQKLISFTALYFIALLSLYLIMYLSLNPITDKNLKDYFKLMYIINMGFIYMIYFYIGSYLTSNSMASEKEKGTFDFLRMTTIDRKVIAIGKLLGGPVFPSYLILLNLPFILLFNILGDVSFSHFIMVIINLIVFGFLFHSMSLFTAILSPKASSANSIALIIPIMYSTVSLSLPGSSSNPFYSLFTPLSYRLDKSENLSFFGAYFPAYILNAAIIIFLFYWLMKGIIRKIDSETNHIYSKKQVLYIYIGVQIFFTGFALNSLLKGETSILTIYYLLSLFFNTVMTLLINPTKEDSIIYINKAENESKLWNSKSPVFSLILILNLISLFMGCMFNLIILTTSLKLPEFGLGIYLAIISGIFSLIYTQVFYLCNLTFNKNSNVIAFMIVALSTVLPIPINYVTGSKSNIIDIFLYNPLSIISNTNKFGYINLSTITQLIILSITALILNFLIMTKRENIVRRFKI